jgi:hypothetical protein
MVRAMAALQAAEARERGAHEVALRLGYCESALQIIGYPGGPVLGAWALCEKHAGEAEELPDEPQDYQRGAPVPCTCGHDARQHQIGDAPAPAASVDGRPMKVATWCMVPGCACKSFMPRWGANG